MILPDGSLVMKDFVKDGSTVWVMCVGRVIEWAEDGAPIRMVGCHVNITKRKQAEARALVIYHVVPPLPLAALERIFEQGMSEAYDGRIEIAVDGTFVSLPAGSREIEIEGP